jgi:hypothetical protein
MTMRKFRLLANDYCDAKGNRYYKGAEIESDLDLIGSFPNKFIDITNEDKTVVTKEVKVYVWPDGSTNDHLPTPEELQEVLKKMSVQAADDKKPDAEPEAKEEVKDEEEKPKAEAKPATKKK